MATYFRVHPDKMNRDIWDDQSSLYDANLEPVEPDVIGGNDILICATPEEFDAILAGRK
jgi:hypothetical protein